MAICPFLIGGVNVDNKYGYEMEEVYEKCRALISVLTEPVMKTCDRDALLWILGEEFERLGEIIGTVQKK